jgi:hypothetical protein
MWGTTSFCDELTDDFRGAFEATSIDDCRLFCPWRKFSRAAFWDFCNTICQQRTHAPQQFSRLSMSPVLTKKGLRISPILSDQ